MLSRVHLGSLYRCVDLESLETPYRVAPKQQLDGLPRAKRIRKTLRDHERRSRTWGVGHEAPGLLGAHQNGLELFGSFESFEKPHGVLAAVEVRHRK